MVSHLSTSLELGNGQAAGTTRPVSSGAIEQIAQAVRLLSSSRFVTLTRPRLAFGKTRLALAIATKVRDRYRDGVFFVALGHLVTEPDTVAPTVATTLGLQPVTGLSPKLNFWRSSKTREPLVVLDNFEHSPRGILVDHPPPRPISRTRSAHYKSDRLVDSRACSRRRQLPPLALPNTAGAASLADLCSVRIRGVVRSACASTPA